MFYSITHKHTKQQIQEENGNATLPLHITYDYSSIKKIFSTAAFKKTPVSHLKYQLLYPIKPGYYKSLSLLEGNTPLHRSICLGKTINLHNLYFKHEGMNPTGAFKDRGSIIEVLKAIEYKAKGMVLASTGNMAASVSAYSKRAKIPCSVFVPETAAKAKLSQALFYGAKIVKIRGNYDQAAKLAEQTAHEYGLYLAGDYAFRTEGQKSQAYEIIEQLNFNIPDYVVVPVGNGTNIVAIWKGFQDYFTMGLINKIPKMIAVEVESHNAVAKAFNAHDLSIETHLPEASQSTVASAIAVRNPSDGNKTLALLKASGGFAISVKESDILSTQITLASKESLFVEPSSAVVYAGIKKLVKQGKVAHSATVVCILSGHGLKDPLSALEKLPKENIIDPNFPAVKKLFEKQKWVKK